MGLLDKLKTALDKGEQAVDKVGMQPGGLSRATLIESAGRVRLMPRGS